MSVISGFFSLITKLVLLAVILVVVAIGYGAGVEPGMLNVSVTRVTSDRWPSFWQPLKIVVLSDLHIGSPHVDIDRVASVVNAVNVQNPDVVFLLGDYMAGDYYPEIEPSAFAPVLGNLKAAHGVFAVLGEHDWRTGDDSVARALAGAGITVLQNEAVPVNVAKGRRFWVVGLADKASPLNPDYRRAAAKVAQKEPVFTLMHNPADHAGVPRQTTISFAGHTHGGLVNIPGVKDAVMLPTDMSKRYVRGLINDAEQLIYVTPGIGSGSIPIRINNRPEVSIVLVSGQ